MTALKKFAVIGDPIDHSLSPKIHKLFAESSGLDISYEAIQVEKKDFVSAVTSLFDSGYEGLNVTLPLKEDAFNYANELSEESKLSGSVNTLWKEGSFICADTTDGRGLVKDLTSKNISLSNLEVVILGAGGSARAIIPSLLKEKPSSITIANRTFSKAEELAKKFSLPDNQLKAVSTSQPLDCSPDLVINTTSAGVLNQEMDLPSNIFSQDTCVYDLSYSREETSFIMRAKNSGSDVCYDGIGMLIQQAALSFEIWTKHKPKTDINKAALL